MKLLGSLNFREAKITDAGLLKLKPLKNLRNVSVAGTPVTAEGARALEAAIPGCKVSR